MMQKLTVGDGMQVILEKKVRVDLTNRRLALLWIDLCSASRMTRRYALPTKSSAPYASHASFFAARRNQERKSSTGIGGPLETLFLLPFAASKAIARLDCISLGWYVAQLHHKPTACFAMFSSQTAGTFPFSRSAAKSLTRPCPTFP